MTPYATCGFCGRAFVGECSNPRCQHILRWLKAGQPFSERHMIETSPNLVTVNGGCHVSVGDAIADASLVLLPMDVVRALETNGGRK